MSSAFTIPLVRLLNGQRVLKIGFTFILLLILSACKTQLIAPGTGKFGSGDFSEVLVPRIEGVLLVDGKPLPGRKITVARNEGPKGVCERPLASVESDEQGRFVVPAIDKKGIPDIQSSIENDWQVCVALADGSPDEIAYKQIWFDRHSGVMWSQEVTSLTCKLDKLESKKFKGCEETI